MSTSHSDAGRDGAGLGTIEALIAPRHVAVVGASPRPDSERSDVAFLAVSAAAGPDLLAQASSCGIRAVIANASGYADADEGGSLPHDH